MTLERTAYAILIVVFLAWLIAMIAGMIAAWPIGILGLLALLGFGLLAIKVLRERLNNREADYYSKNVDR